MFNFTQQGSKRLLRADFKDLYRSQCSIQESSDRNQAALWLGASLDSEGRPSTRMILSQEQVRELIPLLQTFAETGYLHREPGRMPEATTKKLSSPAKKTPKSSGKKTAAKKTAKKKSK